MSWRLYIQLSSLQFLHFFVAGAWLVTVSTYLLYTLEFTGTEVGAVFSSQAFAAVVSPFFMGVFADRYLNSDRLLAVLYSLSGVVLLLLATVKVFFWFFILITLYNLLFLPTFSLISSLSFHHLTDIEKEYPGVRVWGTIGWVIAGLAVGFLEIEYANIPMYIAGGASVVLGGLCFFLPKTPPPAKRKVFRWVDALGLDTLKLLKQRSFAVMVLSLTLVTISVAFYHGFLNPFLNEIGVSNAAGKMTIGQIVEIGVIVLLPFFFSRLGIRKIIIVGMLVWGIRYLLFAFGNTDSLVWMFYLGIAVHGIGYSFTSLSAQIYFDKHVPVEMRSATQGFIALLTMGVGRLIGYFIAGIVVQMYEVALGVHEWFFVWLYPSIIAFVAAFVFWFFFKLKD